MTHLFIAIFLVSQTILPVNPRYKTVLVQPPYMCGVEHLTRAVRVVVLGNSLAWSPPQTAFDWTQSNGMAATTLENDYPHVLCKSFAARRHQTIALLVVQAWDIETAINTNTTWNRDYAEAINAFAPDVLVVQYSDNVVNLDAVARFPAVYNEVLAAMPANTLVCVSGWYQTRPPLNDAIRAACEARQGHYVSIGDIYLAPNMRGESFNTSINHGVGSHPNDLGHYEIARRVALALE